MERVVMFISRIKTVVLCCLLVYCYCCWCCSSVPVVDTIGCTNARCTATVKDVKDVQIGLSSDGSKEVAGRLIDKLGDKFSNENANYTADFTASLQMLDKAIFSCIDAWNTYVGKVGFDELSGTIDDFRKGIDVILKNAKGIEDLLTEEEKKVLPEGNGFSCSTYMTCKEIQLILWANKCFGKFVEPVIKIVNGGYDVDEDLIKKFDCVYGIWKRDFL